MVLLRSVSLDVAPEGTMAPKLHVHVCVLALKHTELRLVLDNCTSEH